jgi:hypothetical protein
MREWLKNSRVRTVASRSSHRAYLDGIGKDPGEGFQLFAGRGLQVDGGTAAG